LTSVSEPIAVAQKILVAHDVSELAFFALSSQLGLKPVEFDGKTKAEPTFMATVRAVADKAFPNDPTRVGNSNALLDQMNRLRVGFKHHGNLPDVSSTFLIFSEVIDLLDEVCTSVIGTSLQELDYAAAIHDGSIRDGFASARTLIDGGTYKEALEIISLTLFEAFRTVNAPTYIKPGEASSDDALLLSGRGVDPASFLVMQKFLPVSHNGEEVHWELRKKGHSENWTEEAARFCLQTAVSVIVRLQSAQAIPEPSDFYDWFEDVVEIVVDSPRVFRTTDHFGTHGELEELRSFSKGDRVIGRVKGRWELAPSETESNEFDLEHAPYIQLNRMLPGESASLFSSTSESLWFARQEVTIGYQSTGWRARIEEFAKERAANPPE